MINSYVSSSPKDPPTKTKVPVRSYMMLTPGAPGCVSYFIRTERIRSVGSMEHRFGRTHTQGPVSSEGTELEITAVIEPKHVNFGINPKRADIGRDAAAGGEAPTAEPPERL